MARNKQKTINIVRKRLNKTSNAIQSKDDSISGWGAIFQHTRPFLVISLIFSLVVSSLPSVAVAEAKDEGKKPTIIEVFNPIVKPLNLMVAETLITVDVVLPQSQTKEPTYMRYTTVTYYSSTVDQTDDTPFITANGTFVRDGIVATNSLPFGTIVRFPELYGDKQFVVMDRMNNRYYNRFDIWVKTREEAKESGIKYTTVEVY